jgi:hypothetical protein
VAVRWPGDIRDRYRLLQLYYCGTPIFLLLDLLFGANIRVTALEYYPVLKYGYYLLCLGCGILTWIVPPLSAVVGLIESSVNILLLILGVLGPYFQLFEQLMSQQTVESVGMTPTLLMNFAISGTIWTISFYRNPLLSGPQRHDDAPK